MTAQPDADADIAWASGRLAEPSHGRLRVTEVRRVDSRVHRLYRLTVVSPTGARHQCYLKRYDQDSLAFGTEQLSRLTRIAAAVDGIPGLLPYTILAADVLRGLVLAAEVPGQSLARLHRSSMLSTAARQGIRDGWYGAGRWLGRLHTQAVPSEPSGTRAVEVADEIRHRLDLWKMADPSASGLADAAGLAVTELVQALGGRPVSLVLCHGDVSAGNIVIRGSDVGFIDFDDARLDMPGLDLSQGLLAIDDLGHFGWIRPPGAQARTREWATAFAAGYARPFPRGPEWWLPHLRNLVVYLLTRARQRQRLGRGRLVNASRYRGLLVELRRTLTDVRRESASGR